MIGKFIRLSIAFAAVGLVPTAARADLVTVTVTAQNLSPANSLSFAPLQLGFNNGTFDAFNNGQVAGAAITSVAEGGSGSAWFPAFAAADPASVRGSVGGALLPGRTASNRFVVDTAVNPFFTFATMLLPSNDYFLGNDSPTRFRLFDATGRLTVTSIGQKARDIWDNGSEAFDPANAAFIVGGVNDRRTPQNGVVNFDFAELSRFNGLATAGGYTFDSQLAADTDVYRISFAAEPVAVPAPPAVALVALGACGLAGVRRLRRRV